MTSSASCERKQKPHHGHCLASRLSRMNEDACSSSSTPALPDDDDCSSSSCCNNIYRRIRFSATVQQHEIPNLDNFSEQEKRHCWYTDNEKDKTLHQCDKIAARMESGKPERANRPYRGLELYADERRKQFHLMVFRLIDAVLDEQEAQWVAGIDDDHDRIAAISRELSAENEERARVVALQDEQEAAAVTAYLPPSTTSSDSKKSAVALAKQRLALDEKRRRNSTTFKARARNTVRKTTR